MVQLDNMAFGIGSAFSNYAPLQLLMDSDNFVFKVNECWL